MPERIFSWPVYDVFQTGGGRPIFLGTMTQDAVGRAVPRAGTGALLSDPRLRTRADQIAARSWTLPVVAKAVASRDYADLLADCEAAALLCSPIARPAEMYDDPHVTRPGGLIHSHYADKKDFRAPGLPLSVDGASPRPVDADLLSIGQHTTDVLSALPQIKRA